MKKYLNIIIAAVFFLFAFFQYNDPDPLLWIIAYTYVACCILLYQFTDVALFPITIGIFVFIGLFISYIPYIYDWVKEGMPSITGTMKAQSPYIEVVRESLGILLILLVLDFYFIKLVQKRH